MQTKRVVLRLALSIGCGIAIHNAASAEEYRGTWEQQMACTPDVWRLCSEQIPDVSRIVVGSPLSDLDRIPTARSSDRPERALMTNFNASRLKITRARTRVGNLVGGHTGISMSIGVGLGPPIGVQRGPL